MKKSELIFAAILVPVDYLMVILAGITAYFLRFSAFSREIRPIIFELPFENYIKVVFLTALAWLVIFAFAGLYTTKVRRRFIDEFYKIFLACSSGIMLLFGVIFMSRELFDSRFIVLAGWIFSIIFVFFGRVVVRVVEKKLFKKGIGVHNLLIIGKDKTTEKIIQLFKKDKSFGYKIVGWIEDSSMALEKVSNFIKTNKVDEILQCEDIGQEKSLELVEFCNEHHIVYKYVPSLFEAQAINVEIQHLGGVPIIELKRTPLDGWRKILKRVFDILGSILAIIIFSPIMLIVAIAVKLDSKGPIFFGYQRIGQYGKPFFYFKFRSMKANTHEMRYDPSLREQVEDPRGWNNQNPMVKYKNDPRITRVGKFIRRTSLDELPEFFNVLIGKMSLVGPRPHEPEEVAKYKKECKHVLTIKPGITGLPQISGRSDLSFEEEVKLDIYYIENWKLKLDLYILFKTPFILLKRRKAD